MNYRLFIALFLVFVSGIYAQSAKDTYTSEEVRQDLEYLYRGMVDAHYDAFAYTTEKELEERYKRIIGTINRNSLTLLETTNLFQELVSGVNNGHTFIGFPGTSYGEFIYSGGRVFPLELAFENGQSLVRKNWSADDRILTGSEVLSINGLSMAEVLEHIYPVVAAENIDFKNGRIELFSFPRYYWQVFGGSDRYEVQILIDGKVEKFVLEAVPALEGYEMKRNELFISKREFKRIGASAYINPGGFDGDEQKFRKFIDSSFAVIQESGSRNLIIDLRNNPGGNDSFSDYLVSYIADKPFTWNSSFSLKTSRFLKEHVRKNRDTTDVYWQKALSHKDGETYPHTFEPYDPQPVSRRFSGRVYVLINRQSYSQAAVTAAQIQDHHFGRIVGEETGDYPSLYASIFQFSVPNTQVVVHVPKGYLVRVNGSTKQEPVIPDLYIRDHLLDEKDEILETLLEKLEQD